MSSVGKPGVETVTCGSYVDTSDVAQYISKKKLTDQDRKLLQRAQIDLIEKERRLFVNCEVRIIGKEIDVVFHAGQPSDIYWIYYDGNNNVERIWKQKSNYHYIRTAGLVLVKFLSNAGTFLGGVLGDSFKQFALLVGAQITPILADKVVAAIKQAM